MKKFLTTLALVGAVATALALPAGAVEPGPPCGDITGLGANTGLVASGALSVEVTLAENACPQVTYTLYVLDAPGGNLLATVVVTIPESERLTTGPTVTFNTVIASAPSVCVYAATTVGPHVVDTAPNGGAATCVTINVDESPGFEGFS